MLQIMNAAMMPHPGRYELRPISAAEFRKVFLLHYPNFISSVGYPNACKVIGELTGKGIPLSREATSLKVGDTILVAKLSYRVMVDEKDRRMHGNNLADYEFFQVNWEPLED